ncbi:MAG: dihydrodipicolinate synthase family protein [Candidatus Aminicenantales bacterium]
MSERKRIKISKKFEGVYAALTTPFEDDEVSLDKFRENIEKYNEFDLSGYVIAGSTGESVFLSEKETELLVKTAAETASPDKKIIAGLSHESLKHTLKLTNKLADIGLEAALIRTPSYYKSLMTDEAQKRYYLSLADKSRIPIIIYNIPRNTGISVSAGLIVELALHQNIAGIKESEGNLSLLSEVANHLPQDFSYLLGAGSLFVDSLINGASGGILALAAVAPELCVKMYNLFLQGKSEKAKRIQLSLIPLNTAIITTYGIPAIKYALDLMGFNGGLPRPPLLPLEEKGKIEMKKILNELKLLDH